MRFRWGETFLKYLDFFSAQEITDIRRRCRELIENYAPYVPAGRGYSPPRRSFWLHECEFLLLVDEAENEGVLELIKIPADKRRRRRRSDAGKSDTSGGGVGALPARARRSNKKTDKRVLLYLYKKTLRKLLLRSPFGQKLSAFLRETSTIRDGFIKTLREARMPPLNWLYLSALRLSMIASFHRIVKPLRHEFREGARLEPRLFSASIGFPLILSTFVPMGSSFDPAWDISLFGEVLEESERLSI